MITMLFMWIILKWSKLLAVYSVYHVKIQLNIATQYTKHRKKCVCSKWEIYNDWQGEKELHMPVFLLGRMHDHTREILVVCVNSYFSSNSNGKFCSCGI